MASSTLPASRADVACAAFRCYSAWGSWRWARRHSSPRAGCWAWYRRSACAGRSMMPADSTGSIGPNTVLTTPVRTNPAWSNASNCSLPACACGLSTARDTGFICYLVRTGFAMDGNSLHTFGNGSHGQISAAGLIHGKGGVLCGTTAAGGGSSSCNGGCCTVFRIVP